MAYYALVSSDNYPLIDNNSGADAAWFTLTDIPKLVFDHNEILDFGLAHIRKEMRHRPVGFELLPEKFTLLDLQSLYETILNTHLDKGNFRRKILNSGLLVECQEKQSGVRHRAAKFYQFDPSKYSELLHTGFSFIF